MSKIARRLLSTFTVVVAIAVTGCGNDDAPTGEWNGDAGVPVGDGGDDARVVTEKPYCERSRTFHKMIDDVHAYTQIFADRGRSTLKFDDVERFREIHCTGLYQTLVATDTGRTIPVSEVRYSPQSNVLVGDLIRKMSTEIGHLGPSLITGYLTSTLGDLADNLDWLCRGGSGGGPDAFRMYETADQTLDLIDRLLGQEISTYTDLQCAVASFEQTQSTAAFKRPPQAVATKNLKTLRPPSIGSDSVRHDRDREAGVAI